MLGQKLASYADHIFDKVVGIKSLLFGFYANERFGLKHVGLKNIAIEHGSNYRQLTRTAYEAHFFPNQLAVFQRISGVSQNPILDVLLGQGVLPSDVVFLNNAARLV